MGRFSAQGASHARSPTALTPLFLSGGVGLSVRPRGKPHVRRRGGRLPVTGRGGGGGGGGERRHRRPRVPVAGAGFAGAAVAADATVTRTNAPPSPPPPASPPPPPPRRRPRRRRRRSHRRTGASTAVASTPSSPTRVVGSARIGRCGGAGRPSCTTRAPPPPRFSPPPPPPHLPLPGYRGLHLRGINDHGILNTRTHESPPALSHSCSNGVYSLQATR